MIQFRRWPLKWVGQQIRVNTATIILLIIVQFINIRSFRAKLLIRLFRFVWETFLMKLGQHLGINTYRVLNSGICKFKSSYLIFRIDFSAILITMSCNSEFASGLSWNFFWIWKIFSNIFFYSKWYFTQIYFTKKYWTQNFDKLFDQPVNLWKS